MRKIHVLSPFALAGLLSFAACVGAPESVETESPAEEPVGESQQAILKKWDHLLSLRMGGAGADPSPRVATDSSGNMIVAGTFSGSITLGGGAAALTSAGASDVFVVKLSPTGAVLWSVRLGGTGTETAASVAVDGAGNVLVTGRMDGPVDFGGGAVNGTAYGGDPGPGGRQRRGDRRDRQRRGGGHSPAPAPRTCSSPATGLSTSRSPRRRS